MRILIIALSLLSGPLFADCAPSAWLAGQWQSAPDQKGGYWQEEWQLLDADNWQGQGRQYDSRGALLGEEDLRLVRMGGQWFYLAKVSHNARPVAFGLQHCDGKALKFENPQHDFPQSLHYRLLADQRLEVVVANLAGKRFTLLFSKK